MKEKARERKLVKVTGSIQISPPLSGTELSWLLSFSLQRHCSHLLNPFIIAPCGEDECHDRHPDVPELWCQWEPSPSGEELYYARGAINAPEIADAQWLSWLLNHVFTGEDVLWPHHLSGEVVFVPEASDDFLPWAIGTDDVEVWIDPAPEVPAEEGSHGQASVAESHSE
jgi:hypothetical protein